MTRLARLKDVFLSMSPNAALACTYGFEPEFFEQEIIPAMFPDIALDRGAGNAASYLNSGDELLRTRHVVVCCDHYEAGRELPYNPIVVNAGSFAFHPKLLLLDYGDRLRVVVSSANLTRSAWTTSLELFVFEDLPPGGQHAWGPPLARFIEGVQRALVGEARKQLDLFADRTRTVRPTTSQAASSTELVSSFDRPLIDAVTQRMPNADRLDVVTPFLEGAEGAGVFDRLARQYPRARGCLFVRAEDGDGVPILQGPEQKLRDLAAAGLWEIRRVRREWDGDDEEAPPRQLHGKILMAREGRSGVALIGSANVTRAALLGSWPTSNVELGVVIEGDRRQLESLLPQAVDGVLTDFTVVPADSETKQADDAATWVKEALYHSSSSTLELRLTASAPPLEVRYEGSIVGTAVVPPTWSHNLKLRRALEVLVRAEGREAIIPFIVLDPELMEPRGLSRRPGIDELLDIMAGAQEPVDDEAESRGPARVGDGPAMPASLPLQGQGGAFAWRRLMRGLAGLERDLVRGCGFESEVRRLLDGPLGARALLEVLDELRRGDNFLDADYAFAVHQLRCTLGRVRPVFAESPTGTPDASLGHLDRWIRQLKQDFDALRRGAPPSLRRQLTVLAREV